MTFELNWNQTGCIERQNKKGTIFIEDTELVIFRKQVTEQNGMRIKK